jgi:hypothetical protein
VTVLPEITLGTLAVKIAELEKRLDERQAALHALLSRTEEETRQWKLGQNEWGRTFIDLKSQFVTTDRYETAHDALVQRYDQGHRSVTDRQEEMMARLARIEGAGQQGQFNMTSVLYLIGVLVSIVLSVIALFKSGAL